MAESNANKPPAQYPSPSHQYPSPSMQASYAYPPPQGGPEPYRASPQASSHPINLPPIRAMETAGAQPAHQGQPPMPTGLPGVPGHPYYPPPGSHALPPSAAAASGLRASKKEIKRRTKTGCLTCRKRRIKCDEQHPVCRNCQKSRRECLGYDPIFKPTGPQQIQPAPTSTQPQSFNPLPEHGYPPQVHGLPNVPPVVAGASGGGEYAYSPIDPALAGSEAGAVVPPPTSELPKVTPVAIDGLFGLEGQVEANPIKEEEIKDFNIDAARLIFAKEYAEGLDKMLETSWFSLHGLDVLVRNDALFRRFCALVNNFQVQPERHRSFGRQAQMAWSLLSLPRTASEQNGTNGEAKNVQTAELVARLEILECLLTARLPPASPMREVRYEQEANPNDPLYWQREFWRLMGDLVCLRETDAAVFMTIDTIIGRLRQILQQFENRDVLYSLVVCRYYGCRVKNFQEINVKNKYPQSDQDFISKIAIAKRFVEDEGKGDGSNHIIRAVCRMGMQSWSSTR